MMVVLGSRDQSSETTTISMMPPNLWLTYDLKSLTKCDFYIGGNHIRVHYLVKDSCRSWAKFSKIRISMSNFSDLVHTGQTREFCFMISTLRVRALLKIFFLVKMNFLKTHFIDVMMHKLRGSHGLNMVLHLRELDDWIIQSDSRYMRLILILKIEKNGIKKNVLFVKCSLISLFALIATCRLSEMFSTCSSVSPILVRSADTLVQIRLARTR